MIKVLFIFLSFLYNNSAFGSTEILSRENVTVSADGLYEAYTIAGDLYIKDLESGVETQVSNDGSNLILNGYASWVYYEEIFGRSSKYKAFWWSPDSKKIAFYRFDQSMISEFPIYSPFGQNGSLNLTRYPKAGQTNPECRIAIYNLETNITTWADFDYSLEQYFGTPFWSDDSSTLFVQRVPRRQNHLDLFALNASNGSKRLVYSEDYPTWLDFIDGMIFTPKGFYMVRSFETGWEQIYFLGYDGGLKRLTEGENWDVRLMKYDAKKGDLYFIAKRDSRTHYSLYRLDKKGKIITLSDPNYNILLVEFSEDMKSFSAVLSTASVRPIQIEASTKTGMPIFRDDKSLESDASKANVAPCPKIVTMEYDGYTQYGLMTLPRGFDPLKKYPVVMYVYGGPGTSYQNDTWGTRFTTDRWMWENGIIYIVCNPRSSGENGRKGMDEAFGRMTVIELEDYIAWNKWLRNLDFVDGERIGVTGFSFGGTTTSMLVLRYPEYFRCGIAGGGVYDWTLYDSAYTERFMDTPQANPEGYKSASVLNWVPKVFEFKDKLPLPGALMLTHGTGDDNVHFQNTLLLIDALQKVNYQFDLMIYPDGMHGYRGSQAVFDDTMNSYFWTKWLLQ